MGARSSKGFIYHLIQGVWSCRGKQKHLIPHIYAELNKAFQLRVERGNIALFMKTHFSLPPLFRKKSSLLGLFLVEKLQDTVLYSQKLGLYQGNQSVFCFQDERSLQWLRQQEGNGFPPFQEYCSYQGIS